jgi:hypothetical protein
MNGILCPQNESKLDSGKLTKADVEAAIKLAHLSQKIPQIEKFTLNSCQESNFHSQRPMWNQACKVVREKVIG